MTIRNKKEIPALAREITSTTELFGDEVSCVISQLNALYKDAQRYGCAISADVLNMWGGTVAVTALPKVKRHRWVF